MKLVGPRTSVSRALDRLADRVADRVSARATTGAAPPAVPCGGHEVVTRMENGRLIYLDMRDTSVAPHIATGAGWEWGVTQVLRGLARADDVFVDVGANFGYYTLLLSTVIERRPGAFHLFEPNPATARCLRRSLRANWLQDHAVLNVAALSDHEGTMALQTTDEDWGGATLRSVDRPEPPGPAEPRIDVDVEVTRLDHYCEARGIGRVDLVKIDAEGHEDAIVRGMTATIERNPGLRVVLEFTFDAYADPAGFWDALCAAFPVRFAIGYDAHLTPVRTLDDLRAARPGPLVELLLAKRPITR